MKATKSIVLLLVTAALIFAATSIISAESAGDKPACTVRDIEQQVVLYTIHRGGLDKIASVVMNLFNLAVEKGIYPDGPVTFAYLNDFTRTSSEHWLIEIRLPVDKGALKLSGTLGKMTDVKTLAPVKMTVATKPEGMADPRPVYERLYTWMHKEGHMPTSGPQETFLTNAESGDYSKMKTEIMVPIWGPSAAKD
jgi:effector-binding domain-containing protein